MSLRSKVIETVFGAVAVAIVFAVSSYLGVTVAGAVAWAKSAGHFWGAEVGLPRWGFWLWAVLSAAFVTGFLLRVPLVRTASPYDVYRGDDMYGLRWEWDFVQGGKVYNPRMFCIKCFHQFHDSDFKYATPTASGPVWNLACENCGHTVTVPSSTDLYRKVKSEAERRIRTKQWKPYKRELPDQLSG